MAKTTTQINRNTSERIHATFLFFFLLIGYVYTFPRWADPNQDSRLKMVVAVVNDGSFQIDKYLGTTVDYAKVNDHYYSDKAPGVAFIGIPIYAILNETFETPFVTGLIQKLESNPSFQTTLNPEGSGISTSKIQFALGQVIISFFAGALPTAILGVLIFRWLSLLNLSAWLRLIIAIGYGLLTPAYAYANTMYGHQLSAALLFGAFYWVSTKKESSSPLSLLAIGILLSYSVITEYPTVLIVGILFLYLFYHLYKTGYWKRIFWVLATALPIALAWMLYNNTIFGGPLNLGYSYSELWVNQHETGFMSLTIPSGAALWGITFGWFRGLFALSPWLLFSFPGLVLWWKKGQQRAEWFVTIGCLLSIYFFNASSGMWWGGFAIGPRYILPALPFLILPIGYAVDQWKSKSWFWVSLTILMTWSLAAVWGLTLAGQAFPSDAILNPLLEYAWPNWLNNQIARNIGTIIDLEGRASLLPLFFFWSLMGIAWGLVTKPLTRLNLPNSKEIHSSS